MNLVELEEPTILARISEQVLITTLKMIQVGQKERKDKIRMRKEDISSLISKSTMWNLLTIILSL